MILTSDSTWDPSILDFDIDDEDEWFDSISDNVDHPSQHFFDEYGDSKGRVKVSSHTTSLDGSVDMCVLYHTNQHLIKDLTSDEEHTSSTDDGDIFFDPPEFSLSSMSFDTYSVFNGDINKSQHVDSKPSHTDYEKQRPLFS